MSIPDSRLQELLANKDSDLAAGWCGAHDYSEGWRIIDGALIIYDVDNPPKWLPKYDWEEGATTVPGK